MSAVNMNSKSSALEGLPKQFVTAMKTLFEIMDDKKTGFVRLTDLETFWSEEGYANLPRGVVESLRKVTPPNGFLSFERFCAGLKIALLRYQVDQPKPAETTNQPHRSPSAPILDIPDDPPTPPSIPPPVHPRSPTAAVRPNNAALHQRAISMPQLKPSEVARIRERRAGIHTVYGNVPPRPTQPGYVPNPNPPSNTGTLVGPPKPPRVNQGQPQAVITNGALMMRQRSDMGTRPLSGPPKHYNNNNNSNSNNICRLLLLANEPLLKLKYELRCSSGKWRKWTRRRTRGNAASKRRDPRRHTLQNGVDQSMMRRLQALEQERQVLVKGLQAVETAKEWYSSQLSNVQERIRSLGKSTNHDYSLEAQQERLGFKMARIEEVGRQLALLVENSDRGLPAHMNLAVADRNKKTLVDNGDEAARAVRRLKDQNRQLTEEVGRKSERISLLEKEKSALIRELFQSRAQQQHQAIRPGVPSDDNTFM
nr:EOG090X08VB [Eulimnadia texana]